MKFLVDAQCPPKLGEWLRERGHEATHVSDLLGGLRLPDTTIRAEAAASGRIIVTKDKDFLDLAAVFGTPPVVLHLAIGNASTAALLQAFQGAWAAVAAELERPDAGVVVLTRSRLVVTRAARRG